MLLELFTVILAMYTCNAQDVLTCLRTDDIINQQRPLTTNTQGRPGRRGPPGLKGEPGVGLKGEPGVPDNALINAVKGT